MYKFLIPLGLCILAGGAFLFWTPLSRTIAEVDVPFIEREPDIPTMLKNAKSSITKEEFLEERAKAFGILRGLNNDAPVEPHQRGKALIEFGNQQEELTKRRQSPFKNSLLASWTPIGPAPIIFANLRYSGRVTAIAVHPTNPDIVFAGAAQGGVYRSTNGGISWTPLMDGAAESGHRSDSYRAFESRDRLCRHRRTEFFYGQLFWCRCLSDR